jgi:hypothetical protein
MELRLGSKQEKFHKIFKRLLKSAYENSKKRKCRIHEIGSSGVHRDYALYSDGITVEYHDDNDYTKKIKFIVNPSRILGGDDLNIWKPKKAAIKKLLNKLDSIITDYFNLEIELDDFELYRVDFTVNIDVGSRANVTEYIKVLHKLGRVKGFSSKYNKNDYNNTTDMIDKTLSFDLTGNSNDIDFSVYDKEAEIEQKLDNAKKGYIKSFHNERQKDAKGLLRAEVRVKKPKALRKYTDSESIAEQIRDLALNSREIFMETFLRIVPYGNFVKLKDAERIVAENIGKKRLKEKMLLLLRLITEKKSLYLALKEMNDRNIDRVISEFNKLELCPVTISKRQNVKYLKNLYEYLT